MMKLNTGRPTAIYEDVKKAFELVANQAIDFLYTQIYLSIHLYIFNDNFHTWIKVTLIN